MVEGQEKSKKRNLWWVVILAIFLFLTVFVVAPVIIFIGFASNFEKSFSGYSGEFDELIVIDGNEEEKIVQLTIEGIIGDTGQSFFMTSSPFEQTLAQLKQVQEDPDVKAVVIHVNSPGGSVSASDKIYKEILKIKESGKKVIVSMGDTAASGGYYIAAPADKIYALPHTLTGSLGVIMSLPNYEKLAEKIGFEEVVIKSGEMKDIGSPTREMTEEEREVLQSFVDESYEEFVRIISEGRNMSKDEVKKIADGRIYSGNQALQNGLVDELGDLEEATNGAFELIGSNDAMVVSYQEPPVTFSDFLFGLKQTINDPFGTKQMIYDQSPKLQYLWRN